ncbi:unnamed protein product [Closterium sp. Yama58-4]|nr:unnamed protein product [Closterium sp. Yama58-4]
MSRRFPATSTSTAISRHCFSRRTFPTQRVSTSSSPLVTTARSALSRLTSLAIIISVISSSPPLQSDFSAPRTTSEFASFTGLDPLSLLSRSNGVRVLAEAWRFKENPLETAKHPRMVTLFSVECGPYFDWQTVGLMHSYRRSKQPGPITRLLSCTEEQLKDYPNMDLAPTHTVPSMSINYRTGDW